MQIRIIAAGALGYIALVLFLYSQISVITDAREGPFKQPFLNRLFATLVYGIGLLALVLALSLVNVI